MDIIIDFKTKQIFGIIYTWYIYRHVFGKRGTLGKPTLTWGQCVKLYTDSNLRSGWWWWTWNSRAVWWQYYLLFKILHLTGPSCRFLVHCSLETPPRGRTQSLDHLYDAYWAQTARPSVLCGSLALHHSACWDLPLVCQSDADVSDSPPQWDLAGDPGALCVTSPAAPLTQSPGKLHDEDDASVFLQPCCSLDQWIRSKDLQDHFIMLYPIELANTRKTSLLPEYCEKLLTGITLLRNFFVCSFSYIRMTEGGSNWIPHRLAFIGMMYACWYVVVFL